VTFVGKLTKNWPWLPIAIIAYYLPWVWHPAAALTANAYDLAEWVSIYPTVRGGNPALVEPFLLRSTLAGLALLCGLTAIRDQNGWRHWLYPALALVLDVTLLPPPDFFRGAGDDPNYRQQFLLAVGTLLLLAIIFGLRPRLTRYAAILQAVVALAVLVGASVGEALALRVVQSLSIAVTLGGGIMLLYVALLPVIVAALIPA